MITKKLYIISHSSMDLVSVLGLYEQHRRECEVIIIISSTTENLQFLQSLNIPKSALRFVYFESRYNLNKKRLARYLRQLMSEKQMLDDLNAEIVANSDNELFFHSYDNDPHAGYLVSRVAETNRVTLVDVLGIKPRSLTLYDLFTKNGVKNIMRLVIFNSIFGRLFMLSGTRAYPILSLDLERVNIARETGSVGGNASALAKGRYHVPDNGKNVVFLYSDSFGVCKELHESLNREIVECLAMNDLDIYVKVHPQSQCPGFLEDYDVHYILKYVPFELVDLANVSSVIGIAGASLLCTGDVPTVSTLKLFYQGDSDHYKSAMVQLRQNPGIMFVSSMDELQSIIAKL